MNAEELAGRVVVRHREAGHLRLELPPELCHARTAGLADASLREVEGVYRVDFDLASRRLSIRFDAHVCSVGQVARKLKELIEAVTPHLPAAAPDAAAVVADGTDHDLGARLREAGRAVAVRVNAALDVLRNPGTTPPEGSLQAKLQPVIASALTEKAIINFLNDLVAFYLIKAHWELISQRWLKEPLKYRNAWLTVFYLVFLLVRYRKQAAKK